MDRSISRANVDRYLHLLKHGDLAPDRHATIVKLLMTEEDKLGNEQETLEFAESRAAKGRDLLNQLRHVCDGEDVVDRAGAERSIAVFEATQRLLEDFCDLLLMKILNSRL